MGSNAMASAKNQAQARPQIRTATDDAQMPAPHILHTPDEQPDFEGPESWIWRSAVCSVVCSDSRTGSQTSAAALSHFRTSAARRPGCRDWRQSRIAGQWPAGMPASPQCRGSASSSARVPVAVGSEAGPASIWEEGSERTERSQPWHLLGISLASPYLPDRVAQPSAALPASQRKGQQLKLNNNSIQV